MALSQGINLVGWFENLCKERGYYTRIFSQILKQSQYILFSVWQLPNHGLFIKWMQKMPSYMEILVKPDHIDKCVGTKNCLVLEMVF
jgi:hypothetical protein